LASLEPEERTETPGDNHGRSSDDDEAQGDDPELLDLARREGEGDFGEQETWREEGDVDLVDFLLVLYTHTRREREWKGEDGRKAALSVSASVMRHQARSSGDERKTNSLGGLVDDAYSGEQQSGEAEHEDL
jgi:hypothetical protein